MKNKYKILTIGASTLVAVVATTATTAMTMQCSNNDREVFSQDEENYNGASQNVIKANYNHVQDLVWGEELHKNYWDSLNTNPLELKEYETRRNTGFPYEPIIESGNTDWKPGYYSDDSFARSTVPLNEERYYGKKLKDMIYPHRKIQFLWDLSSAHQFSYPSSTYFYDYKNAGEQSNFTKAGSDEKVNNLIDQWEYLDEMVAWNSHGGMVEIPKASMVNVAHRNGVPVIGTIFIAQWNYADAVKTYKTLIDFNDVDASARKYALMAKYYGFDGWYLNDEASGIGKNKEVMSKIREFLKLLDKYGKQLNKNFRISVYQIGNNLIPSSQRGKDYEFSYSYGSWRDKWPTSKNGFKAQDEVPNSYHLFENSRAGFSGKGTNSARLSDLLKHKQSLSYFGRGQLFNKEETQQKFWTDANGNEDPRIELDLSKNEAFVAASNLTTEKTTLGNGSWQTSFNKGMGMEYYRNGRKIELSESLSKHGYENDSFQELLPTYRYIIDKLKNENDLTPKTVPGNSGIDANIISLGNDEYRVKRGGNLLNKDSSWQNVDIDKKVAYNGSSVLNYVGELKQGEAMRTILFASDTKAKNGDKFELAFSSKNNLGIELSLIDEVGNVHIVKPSETKTISNLGKNDMHVNTYDISNIKNLNKIKSVGFSTVNNNLKDISLDLDIQHLAYKSSTKVEDSNKIFIRPDTFKFDDSFSDEMFDKSAMYKNLRINWNMNSEYSFHKATKFEIYAINGKKEELIGLSASDAAWIENIKDCENILIKGYDELGRELVSQKVQLKH